MLSTEQYYRTVCSCIKAVQVCVLMSLSSSAIRTITLQLISLQDAGRASDYVSICFGQGWWGHTLIIAQQLLSMSVCVCGVQMRLRAG